MSDRPIEETVLDGLRLLNRGDRPDMARTVVMLFLESAPIALKDLRAGASNNDPDLLSRASHILGSSSAAVGATSLSAHCKELERAARTGPMADAAERVEIIERLYRDAEGALRVWCSQP